LGWDTRDLDEVHREFKARKSDKPVDYALQMLRKPRLFIEAKGLGEDLSDRKWISQVLSYATVAGVSWCVLTDGDEYCFYNATAPVDAEEKLFCKIRLSDESAKDLAKTLELISRSNLEGNLLDAYWKSHFVDRRVIAALRHLLETPHRGLVRLIRQTTPELTPREIEDSILRLDAHIEPPPAWNTKPRSASSVRRSPGRRATTMRKSGAKRQEFGVTLKQLIDDGLLKTPLRLFRRYKGKMLEGVLHDDGSVEFGNERFDTCSRAAERARESVTGRRMNTNGWQFWQCKSTDGKKRELLDIRAEYITKQGSP
jgi:hypothetical protein